MRIAVLETRLPLTATPLNILLHSHPGSLHRKGGSRNPKEDMGLRWEGSVKYRKVVEFWKGRKCYPLPQNLDLPRQGAAANSSHTGSAGSLNKTHYSRRRKSENHSRSHLKWIYSSGLHMQMHQNNSKKITTPIISRKKPKIFASWFYRPLPCKQTYCK